MFSGFTDCSKDLGWLKDVLASLFWLLLLLGAVLGTTLGQTQFIYNQF